MVTVRRRSEGKTEFVEEALRRDPRANPEAVNKAWSASGKKGSISVSLVRKVKMDMGLTGKGRPGPRPSVGNGAAASGMPVKRGPGRPPKSASAPASVANGRTLPPVAPRPTAGDKHRVLEQMEHEIDRLLYRLTEIGGLGEVEDALRRARRVLIRSHAG
jgi:hypothetical protein